VKPETLMVEYFLHGSFDEQTNEAKRVLEKRGISYRFEFTPDEVYENEGIALVGFGGTFQGLNNIRQAFG
tara:strand:- start:638 stop:847 length:210 start_codon:yes stop_codon:yes gene_type:complete